MPKKGRRSGQDEALGADLGGLGGDADYDWIKYIGDGRSSSLAGSSPASSASASTALRSPARTSTERTARPAAAPPAGRARRFGRDADQVPDGDTDPGGRRAAGRRAEPSQPYERQPYERQPHEPQSGGPASYQPGPYEPLSREPQSYEPQSYEPGPAQRGGRGSVLPSRTPAGAASRRAVKVRQGRTTDLLFNPAVEDYGQPLYAPNAGGALASPDRQQEDRFTSPRQRLDTAEYARPLYSEPESGPITDARPRRPGFGADPLTDTDARGRAVPGARRSDRSRRAGPVTPASAGSDRTGPQPWIDDLSGADPRTTGPQRRIDERRGADVPGGPRRGERAGPQQRAGARSRPGPLTDSGIGVLQESGPTGIASAAAISRSPAKQAGIGPFDEPDFDVAEPLEGTAGLPRTSPRGKQAGKPRKAAKKVASGTRAAVKGRLRSGPRKKVLALLGGLVIIALAAVGYVELMPRTSHTVSAPAALSAYVKQQANATANDLRHRIVTAAAGDVKNVVAAVYERKTGPGTSKGPQVVVFIGGNLTGSASAGDLISAYMTGLQGSFTTDPGRLGGQAACAPGSDGGPSECAWADGDTFGVVVSATLSATGLADEMRQMRPLVEHVAR